jgi:pimeloyl-ACP methyl ester carboxylesterase
MIAAKGKIEPKQSRFRRIGRKLIIGTCISAILYLGIALSLVFWPGATFERPVPANSQGISTERNSDNGVVRERMFKARDGATIAARVHGDDGLPTLLVIHGVASQAKDMDAMAALLTKTVRLRVVAIDLRGHGRSSGSRWQLDHVGQFEEDLSDIVGQIRSEAPSKPIVLAGHSMGGGIALRYALASNSAPVEGFLLLTPLLGGDSPSMTKNDATDPKAGHNPAAELPVIFRTPRMIGVIMLHSVGITAFDQLPIMLFNHPDRPSYGFAALASMQPNAPADYRVALKAVSKPLMLIAGDKDEYFEAAAFPNIISQNSNGESILIENANHTSILTDSRSIISIVNWLGVNNLR